jgi:hypothetical protein
MSIDLFNEEIRDKKRDMQQLRSKTGSRGSSGSRKGMRTAYDYMSVKEKRKMNSAVSVKNLFDLLLSKQEFEGYPEEKQREILTRWRDIYPNQKIMEALEIKSQGTFNTLLQKLNVPKKRSWSNKKKQQPEKGKSAVENETAAVLPNIEKMDIPSIVGLQLFYNGEYESDQLSKILTKLQLLIEGEENLFEVSISLQEKK